MKKVIMLLVVALTSACASTGMYSTPSGSDTATVEVENLLDTGTQEATEGATGWQMPGMAAASRVGVFTVDGDRVDESGGDKMVTLDAGEHTIQLFADDGGMLRFKKFSMTFEEGAEYVIKVMRNDGKKNFRATVANKAAPETVLEEVSF
jgi:hypothetical protein